MNLPLWAELGGAVGTTLVIVRGALFAGLRKRLPMLGCAQCAGWWVGALAGLTLTHPIASVYETVANVLVFAGLVSALSVAADAATAWIDAKAFEAERKS